MVWRHRSTLTNFKLSPLLSTVKISGRSSKLTWSRAALTTSSLLGSMAMWVGLTIVSAFATSLATEDVFNGLQAPIRPTSNSGHTSEHVRKYCSRPERGVCEEDKVRLMIFVQRDRVRAGIPRLFHTEFGTMANTFACSWSPSLCFRPHAHCAAC